MFCYRLRAPSNGSYVCGQTARSWVQMTDVVPIRVTPESGCPFCSCPIGAAPDDRIEIYVKQTPAGNPGLYAIYGRSFVPSNQSTVYWSFGTGSRYLPFYANVRPGKKFKHAVYMYNKLPDNETVGLSSDGYGWLQFSPAEIEEHLKQVKQNVNIRLY